VCANQKAGGLDGQQIRVVLHSLRQRNSSYRTTSATAGSGSPQWVMPRKTGLTRTAMEGHTVDRRQFEAASPRHGFQLGNC
jgi:hypothetical protein